MLATSAPNREEDTAGRAILTVRPKNAGGRMRDRYGRHRNICQGREENPATRVGNSAAGAQKIRSLAIRKPADTMEAIFQTVSEPEPNRRQWAVK
jgi:hypothetical protein